MGDIVYHYKTNLYINLTNQCPNKCEFCDIESIGQDINSDLIVQTEPDFDKVVEILEEKLNQYNVKEVVFCGGGEPLMRLDLLLEIANYIDKNHSVDIRINTTGYPYIFYDDREVVKELKESEVDSVVVSVNSTSEQEYQALCNPKIEDAYQKTLNFVEKCKQIGLNTSMSFVDYNIDIQECKNLARKLGTGIVIRGYAPID